MEQIANTPEPPYYAVIFTSIRTSSEAGYSKTAERMLELAQQQPGFLGVDSVRNNGFGITVSYWKDEASIQHWKQQTEHLAAQQAGKENWYEQYCVQIARVERSYKFNKKNNAR